MATAKDAKYMKMAKSLDTFVATVEEALDDLKWEISGRRKAIDADRGEDAKNKGELDDEVIRDEVEDKTETEDSDDEDEDEEEEEEEWVDNSIINNIPEELFYLFLTHVDAYCLAKCQMVCRVWREIASEPSLWEHQCKETWKNVTDYGDYGSWQNMYVQRPRLRYDGWYVARCSYLRQGSTEVGRQSKPAHIVIYYRYLRFFSSGKIISTTSADHPKVAIKWFYPGSTAKNAKTIWYGTWEFDEESKNVRAQVRNRLDRTTFFLTLKSRVCGVNDRLRLNQILFGRDGDEDSESPIPNGGDKYQFVQLPDSLLAKHLEGGSTRVPYGFRQSR